MLWVAVPTGLPSPAASHADGCLELLQSLLLLSLLAPEPLNQLQLQGCLHRGKRVLDCGSVVPAMSGPPRYLKAACS